MSFARLQIFVFKSNFALLNEVYFIYLVIIYTFKSENKVHNSVDNNLKLKTDTKTYYRIIHRIMAVV